ncbi:MAG: efflux RND transporter periplasmic adaptor subunit [Verrucomicrobia bacterium]|nr:efflux RND transporter periplasmic adaptor subunit [Verrucomicrobiota bacterium]MCH8529204.1 efflux RND transporter periplasmic adaptor subunit [Kiritimatiellia bacterium]
MYKSSFLLFLLLLTACGKRTEPPAPETPARPVRLHTVRAADDTERMSFPAVLRARESVELAFDVPGVLEHLNVTEGRAVEKGTLLAALNKRDFESRAASARTAAELAASERARFEQLVGSVSDAEIDRKRAAAATAAEDLNTALSALEKTEIHAPFDGVVSRRLVQNFSTIQAKQPILLFQALSPLDVVIDVPEPLILRVKPGTGEAVDASLRFESLPGQRFPVTFREIATVADPVTLTYAVVFTLDRPENRTVLPGMSATLDVEGILEGGQAVHLVPLRAVQSRPDGTAKVWVFNPDTQTVHAREVQVGPPGTEGVQILSGLSDGEQIVTTGLAQLREGLSVREWTPRDREGL